MNPGRRDGLTSAKAVECCATNGLHLSSVARARCNTKNTLVLSHLWLVDACVRTLRVQGTLAEDATQDGRIALMRAAESFDPTRGTPFAPYARMFVVGAIKSCMTADSIGHCTGSRTLPGEKVVFVSMQSAAVPNYGHMQPSYRGAMSRDIADSLSRNGSGDDEENWVRDIDAGAVARAAVLLPLVLRRAAISMLSGIGSAEHSKRYSVPSRTARSHYRKARIALCKMFR